MHCVDDMGFVDSTFWQGGLREATSLKTIAERAMEWLAGAHVSGEAKSKWEEVEKHQSQKLDVVEAYQQQAKSACLLDPCAKLQKEWLTPTFHPILSNR
jgi:ABC-type branched-subunit amino acid transport system ATPase component